MKTVIIVTIVLASCLVLGSCRLNMNAGPSADQVRSELGGALLEAAAAPFSGNSIDDGPACPFSMPNGEVDPTYLTAALAQVDALARSMLSTTTGPTGLHINVVHGQNLLMSKGYGSRMVNHNATTSPGVTDNTVFRIGSNSKVFTTMALHVLAEAGVVSLDDPLSKWLPEFTFSDPFAASGPITLRHLATFQAGLQREACVAYPAPYNRYLCGLFLGTNHSAVFEAMSHSTALFPRESLTPIYSNLQIELLGWALDSAVKQSSSVKASGYYDYMSSMFSDLGMTSTGFNVTADIRDNFAWCATSVCDNKTMFSDFGFANPAGGMFTSGSDMGQWLKYLVGAHNDSAPSPLQLSKATQRAFQRVATPFSAGTSGYGYSSMVAFVDGDWLFTKGGAVPGYNSAIMVVPELQLGISILTASLGFDGSTFTLPAYRIMKPAIQQGRAAALDQMYSGTYIAPGLPVSVNITAGATSMMAIVTEVNTKKVVAQALLPGAEHTFFTTAEAGLSCYLQETLISSYTASFTIGGEIFAKDEITFIMDGGQATGFTNNYLNVVFKKQ